MLVLGIESSCDETAAAVARGPGEEGAELLSSVVASQDELHARFGGIVPEVASRRHIEIIVPVIREAMQRAGVDWDDIGGLAVTNGPGLIGSLVVGVATAKGIAQARDVPIAGIHHLEAHIYGAAVGQALPLPLLALVASGGHSHLVLMRDHGAYEVLARTRDDAPGEAFEKGARLLGFAYPGVGQLAQTADAYRGPIDHMPRAKFPRSWDFSFSGIKTELSRRAQKGPLGEQERARLAASYQEAIARTLVERVAEVSEELGHYPVVVVGGVARNQRLRQLLAERAEKKGIAVHVPEPRFCTDNAAMVAAAGLYKLTRVGGEPSETIDVAPDLPLQSWGRPETA